MQQSAADIVYQLSDIDCKSLLHMRRALSGALDQGGLDEFGADLMVDVAAVGFSSKPRRATEDLGW